MKILCHFVSAMFLAIFSENLAIFSALLLFRLLFPKIGLFFQSLGHTG